MQQGYNNMIQILVEKDWMSGMVHPQLNRMKGRSYMSRLVSDL